MVSSAITNISFTKLPLINLLIGLFTIRGFWLLAKDSLFV